MYSELGDHLNAIKFFRKLIIDLIEKFDRIGKKNLKK